ncbi:MAG TPA: EamA family transporter, partial [Burkholderiales bacterium]|nr:EamA family transporter [Burkholderiales bacterium]
MTLPLDVTLLVLLAALMHAAWNAIAKAGTVTLLDIATMAVAAAALCAVVLPFLPFPERASWPWLAASVLLHFLYFVALVGAYQWGDLS